jgi:hypothetical protein
MLTILRNALIGLCVLGLASTALAQDPEAGDISTDAEGDSSADSDEVPEASGAAAARPISVGLLLGYGAILSDSPLNPWGLGFGLRGGYNIDAIYLGARFVYYLGEDPVNLWELGIEGGYDFGVGPVVIRPQLGLGIVGLTVEIPMIFGMGGGTETETELYIAPGGSVLYDINEQFFVGGELRLKFVMSDPGIEALTILANLGMRF